jgi:hypothetical protein
MQIANCKLKIARELQQGICRVAITAMAMLVAATAIAADNELTPEEKAEGWVLLFDGMSLNGWKNNTDKAVTAKVEDGAINPHETGGYLLVYDKTFADFVLKCDVKMDQPFCNSGVFVRNADLEDPVQSSLEVQISSEREPDLHGFAALYDLVAPSKNATKGPGNWDALEIRCEGPLVTVKVNGEEVTKLNCDEWTEAGKRPDGSSTKFKQPIKDFPRKGYIGLQDHGYNAWFKNIKVKEL